MEKGITAAAKAVKPGLAVNSTTTQNVAGGVVASGGAIAGAIGFVRAAWPDVLPWGAEADPALVVVLTTVVAPVVSRIIAFWREPVKAALAESKPN